LVAERGDGGGEEEVVPVLAGEVAEVAAGDDFEEVGLGEGPAFEMFALRDQTAEVFFDEVEGGIAEDEDAGVVEG
jgi:hypothetical protein